MRMRSEERAQKSFLWLNSLVIMAIGEDTVKTVDVGAGSAFGGAAKVFNSAMLQQKSPIVAYDAGPLGYLVATRKALPILLAHKIGDARVQRLLVKAGGAFLAVAGVSIGGFSLIPTLWALGILLPAFSFFALVLCLDIDDLFLQFALEDERFFEAATRGKALSVFEERALRE
jgi:hypothetical protein